MKQYEMYELSWQGAEPDGSDVLVDLTAEFKKGEKTFQVKGFYAGNQTYKLRFYPTEAGTWQYRVSGVIEEEGELICELAAEGKHGMVKADGTHFRYEDGTWYYPFGTTVYALVHQEKELVDQTMETLKTAPFNKIRMCVFPKSFVYNTNEPPYFAFQQTEDGWDVNHPCFEYWDELDRRIEQLLDMGIQCDLILFHPYDRWNFTKLTREQGAIYLDYLCRRLSAYPHIWWSLANEYDIVGWNLETWEHYAKFLHENDVWGHLLSNHQIFKEWDFSNPYTSHICVQNGNVEIALGHIQKYQKPMMVDECGYEGNLPEEWGNLSAREMVRKFWITCLQGAYCTHGETFLNPKEIVWWSKGGKLIGKSPARIAFLREIMESLPGPLTGTPSEVSEKVAALRQGTGGEFSLEQAYQLFGELSNANAGSVTNGTGKTIGHYEDEVYLQYLDGHCACEYSVDLPEGSYDIEVIDTWEMTREVVLRGVSEHAVVPLPGKEGMAILVKKVGK